MLTLAQYQTLKTFISNDPTLSLIVDNEDGDDAIAIELNKLSNPVFNVWDTEASATSIMDAVDFSKYTPNDAVPTDSQLNAEIWKARAQASTIKRDNLWAILDVTNGLINASKANVRAGLRDAVIGVPTGASGASTAPGGSSGVNVLNACVRSARLIEKVLATGPATTGTVTANIMGYVGEISRNEVGVARRQI